MRLVVQTQQQFQKDFVGKNASNRLIDKALLGQIQENITG